MFIKKNPGLKVSSLAVIIASASSPVQAQDQTAVEEIIVVSSRVPIPLRQIATSVSVLDFEDIEARGTLALSDILRQMPAVGSSSNGGIGKPTNVRIRGEEGFRTLTYIDGMRLQDSSTPQISTDFDNLISSGIGRVEMLRGPQGLAFGADAGGVISLSTRASEEPFTVNLDAQGGEFGTQQFAGNVAGKTEKLDYFLSVADYQTDGFNSRPSDLSADEDGYENTTFHGRIAYNITDEWRVDLVHRDVDGNNEYDGCFGAAGPSGDCINQYDLSATRIGIEYNGEAFSHMLSYMDTESDRADLAEGAFSFGNLGEQTRAEYVGSATELPGFDLVWGADHQEDLANGIGRDNIGAFVEVLSDFSENVFFTAGLRHDDNDDFGTNTSYRVSGAYLAEMDSGTLKFKTAIGTGFRAPSPFEIQYNSGPFSFPPASTTSLLAEESEGWEIGVEYLTGLMRLEAVYFDQDVENAIFFDLAAFSGYLQDVGTSTSQGVELTAEVQLNESFRINGNITFNDTERPDGTSRLRRPENLFNVGLMYTGLDNRLSLNAFYRSQADSIDVGNVPLDDFGVLDFTGSYQISDNVRVYGRLENVLDEDYQEIIDYNSAEFAAYIGVSVSFSGN